MIFHGIKNRGFHGEINHLRGGCPKGPMLRSLYGMSQVRLAAMS